MGWILETCAEPARGGGPANDRHTPPSYLVAVGASVLPSRISGRDPPVTTTGPTPGKCNYELQVPGTSFPISGSADLNLGRAAFWHRRAAAIGCVAADVRSPGDADPPSPRRAVGSEESAEVGGLATQRAHQSVRPLRPFLEAQLASRLAPESAPVDPAIDAVAPSSGPGTGQWRLILQWRS